MKTSIIDKLNIIFELTKSSMTQTTKTILLERGKGKSTAVASAKSSAKARFEKSKLAIEQTKI